MGEAEAKAHTADVDHPLWARYQRWTSIHPKKVHFDNSRLVSAAEPHDGGPRLESLPDYVYSPLNDPKRDVRIVELLPGKFHDNVKVRIHHVTPRAPPGPKPGDWREELEEIRKNLPEGWEAFKTIVERKLFFRRKQTGEIQWHHPASKLDPRRTGQYDHPPKDSSFPHYETLSYVWGESAKTAVVEIEGHDVDRGVARLMVTESLITALRYLRWVDRKRNLWIDAICLDQNNFAELNEQVPRMGEIYRLAYTGTAWLGVEGDDSHHAMETLRYLGRQTIAEGDTGLFFCSPDADEESKNWYDPDFELPYSKRTWDAIIALLHRPWFDRLWVVQEIHPGAVLQCGDQTLPISTFCDAEVSFYCKTKLPPRLELQILQANATFARFWTMALPRVLYRATFKECSDPRDKIYGLLGLAPPNFAKSMRVDYGQTNTAADVYKMTVLNHAKITERLELFHNCYMMSDDKRTIPKAPSWVPDWASGAPGESYIPSQFVTLSSRAHYSHSADDDDVLRVLGMSFGRVSHVTKPLPSYLKNPRDAIETIRGWEPSDLDSATYAPTGEPLRKAYAITLICNVLKEREPDWIMSTVDTWARQDWDEALFGDHQKPVSTEAASQEMRLDTIEALHFCAGRMSFRTDAGYIGLGPAETEPNDLLATFLGTPNPVILRPVAGTDQYSVVGECFAHGLENGNSLLGPLPKPWIGIAAWLYGDRRIMRYVNTETQERTLEDPRLESPKEWERVDRKVERDDPTLHAFFQHKETKELIKYDPRLEPELLKERGVDLTWFSLV